MGVKYCENDYAKREGVTMQIKRTTKCEEEN
ncbi:uncharacterized protein G2W53_038584 [Senna tora]|uniref:Uncharacterized protein n=1 Tax=Senna tora TaxID=362788 RepID=A0A834SLA9_9FABA|nr:uncharacterized protein G2W53_038584 [Senna tora]